MFRFTVRELMMLTATVCASLGWFVEHQIRVQASTDAETLAVYFNFGACTTKEHTMLTLLMKKYGQELSPSRIETDKK